MIKNRIALNKISPIIKLTEVCNFNCLYCYYRERMNDSHEKYMSRNVAVKILTESMKFNKSNGKNTTRVIWHGGEPLMYNVNKFDLILSEINEIAKDLEVSVTHTIQTNGFLVSEEWIKLFKKHSIQVGVSIDGPAEINDAQRGNDGEPITQKIIDNINWLKSEGCYSGILSVITNNHAGKAKDYYDFCINNNLSEIGLGRCFIENGDTLDNDIASKFFIELFDLYFYGNYDINIREFSLAMSNGLYRVHNFCCAAERSVCGCFLSFSPNGNVYFCDNFDNYSPVGNIKIDDLMSISKSNALINYRKNALDNFEVMCKNCRVVDMCRGGCPRHDVTKDGKVKNVFCESYISLYEHIKKTIEKHTNN